MMIALLNLPQGSTIGLDGHSFALKRDDFIGIVDVPKTIEYATSGCDKNRDNVANFANFARPLIHFITVRPSSFARKKNTHNITIPLPSDSAITVGYFVELSDHDSLLSKLNDEDSVSCRNFIREYDPYTEEVSAKTVDRLTIENLLKYVSSNQVDSHRLVPYQSMISSTKTWTNLTSYITPNLLTERRICIGEKIVPGAADDDDSVFVQLGSTQLKQQTEVVDGKSVQFPPIPIFLHSIGTDKRRLDHVGTKRFMKHLQNVERTALFMDPRPATALLEKVLEKIYKGTGTITDSEQLLLGDLQLSFCLFIYLHCYPSLIHWRDLIAMLCLVELEGIKSRVALFIRILLVLTNQVQTLSATEHNEFWLEDQTENNCVLESFQILCDTLSIELGNKDCHNTLEMSTLLTTFTSFQHELKIRFPLQFEKKTEEDAIDDKHMDIENGKRKGSSIYQNLLFGNDEDFDGNEHEDGPVIVPYDEVEDILQRISSSKSKNRAEKQSIDCSESKKLHSTEQTNEFYRNQYPLLFASMDGTDGHEDVVMTCARALDQKNDVSLVREAASYLETVESKRTGRF